MKKVATFLLLAVLFAGCSSDDDNDDFSFFNIVDTWEYKSLVTNVLTSDDEATKLIKDDIDKKAVSPKEVKFIFNSDKNVDIIDSESNIVNLPYKYANGHLVIYTIEKDEKDKDVEVALYTFDVFNNYLIENESEVKYYQNMINTLYPDKKITVSTAEINYRFDRK